MKTIATRTRSRHAAFGQRASALVESIVSYLDSQTPKCADLALLQNLHRPGFTRADVSRALDSLGESGRVLFVVNGTRITVALVPVKATVTK